MSKASIQNAPGSAPLAARIEQRIRGSIERGELRAGTRLPSIRKLSLELEVSRNTVIEAYDRLLAQGLVRSRQGSGYFVEDRHAMSANGGGMADPRSAEDVSGQLWHLFREPNDQIKLGCGWLPNDWREVDDMGYAVRQVARQAHPALFDYSTPLGNTRLRELLHLKLRGAGIRVDANQLLLSTDASHALDLLVRYLLKPGDVVLVESPGYYNLFGLLKLQGIQMVGVPRTEEGPDIDALERLLAQHRPKLFFVNSVFHNPTGTTLSAFAGHRLLQLAERFDFLIVEDDIYADFQSEPSIRLAALDQLRRVIYLGSFSKSLSCSLRVGFVAAAPALVRGMVDIKMLTSIASSRFAEEVVTVILEDGSYRKLTERLRRRLEQQMAATLRLMETAGWEIFARPAGGMFIWARRPDIADSMRLVEAAEQRGIGLSSGAAFLPDPVEACPWVRINVTHAADPRAADFLLNPFG